MSLFFIPVYRWQVPFQVICKINPENCIEIMSRISFSWSKKFSMCHECWKRIGSIFYSLSPTARVTLFLPQPTKRLSRLAPSYHLHLSVNALSSEGFPVADLQPFILPYSLLCLHILFCFMTLQLFDIIHYFICLITHFLSPQSSRISVHESKYFSFLYPSELLYLEQWLVY